MSDLRFGPTFFLLLTFAACAAAARSFRRRAAPPRLLGAPASSASPSVRYRLPDWVPSSSSLKKPSSRLLMAHLPTPLHVWPLPRIAGGVEVLVKRDDITGCELSGNKIRKLEFLLADALDKGHDSVITVGGIQSNHCRATAAAARRCGLEPHIILRTDDPTSDPGLVGNLMVDRMVGAEIHLVGPDEFAAKGGGWPLVCELRERLQATEGKNPYCFPSGGSNDLGTWGYIEAINELKQQVDATRGLKVDRVYFACGSGGTAAGLALGMHWSGFSRTTELVGLCVDDTPDFFYDKLNGIFAELGIGGGPSSRSLLRLEQRIGDGYAKSTSEELEYIVEVARQTGIVLDPVYSGKAALGLVADLQANPLPPGSRVVFIHTGGLLGLYEKAEQLAPLLGGGRGGGWRPF